MLISLQAEAVRAADAHDAATLRKLIADDWVISFQIKPGGPFKFSNKAKAIAKWTQIEPNVETKPTEITGARARIDADTETGIVWARVTDHWHDKDGDHVLETDVTDIFALRDGRWVWIASTEALVAPSRP